MNEDRQLRVRKNLVIGVLVVFAALSIFAVVYYFLTRHNEMVVVTNIHDCAERLPGARRDDVFRKLYPYVKEQNVVNGVETKLTYDAVVREGSCKVKEYESDGYKNYNARFILDIEELGYSYRVSFNWVKSGDRQPAELDLGTTGVGCLLESDWIYGSFNCEKNTLIAAANSGDSIMSVLPYFGDGFRLSPTLSASSASGYSIILTFDPPESVYMGGDLDAFTEERRAMMRQYLSENDIDINDYTIVENYEIAR